MKCQMKTNSVRILWTVVMILLLSGFGPALAATQLDATAARSLIQQYQDDPDFVILDIRTPAEYNRGHIAGASLIDYYSPQFKAQLDRLDRTKTYLVYCRSGNRSGKAMNLFSGLGFTRVYHLEKGIIDWQAKGLKLVPKS